MEIGLGRTTGGLAVAEGLLGGLFGSCEAEGVCGSDGGLLGAADGDRPPFDIADAL